MLSSKAESLKEAAESKLEHLRAAREMHAVIQVGWPMEGRKRCIMTCRCHRVRSRS